ncbi:hypothetical protein AWC05_19980 [Mycobacterium florentinum]|uniref:Uncharacterized protein n=1 Tax=Mycobacterium florentinum TaxID=292462 RepID=A0A1X1U9A0_MYCFL|nr:hypothetical protein [Mycobacterium florentinum]MCV7408648.1 hypothetical protein [Mycobacterium florentinum]ORV53395.1 hypothetical protein AWC05_19980 [Mycobacterium florentinum]BBX77440.1 hypothetical protein MFLOJ_12270 [Mycobacterium florentinum]
MSRVRRFGITPQKWPQAREKPFRAPTAWLGLTPEPERSLPALLAGLQGEATVARERNYVTRLILRGTSRRWLRYLDRAAQLALDVAGGHRQGDPQLALAVAHVVLDHDRMLIGLPGNAYYRTAERRKRLAAAIPELEARINTDPWEIS